MNEQVIEGRMEQMCLFWAVPVASPSLSPFSQVVVVWVGTNNHEHTAEQVAGGILAIVQHLISCLPQAKIVVLVSGAGWGCGVHVRILLRRDLFTQTFEMGDP